jgi:hypothetical protein
MDKKHLAIMAIVIVAIITIFLITYQGNTATPQPLCGDSICLYEEGCKFGPEDCGQCLTNIPSIEEMPKDEDEELSTTIVKEDVMITLQNYSDYFFKRFKEGDILTDITEKDSETLRNLLEDVPNHTCSIITIHNASDMYYTNMNFECFRMLHFNNGIFPEYTNDYYLLNVEVIETNGELYAVHLGTIYDINPIMFPDDVDVEWLAETYKQEMPTYLTSIEALAQSILESNEWA